MNVIFPVVNVGSPSADEQAFIDRMEAAGHTVTLWPYNDTTWVAADYDVFFDWRGTVSWQASKYSEDIGICCYNYRNFDDSKIATGSFGENQRDWQIINNTHEITTGFALGLINVYDISRAQRFPVGWANDILCLAQRSGIATRGAILVCEKGEQLHDGSIAAGRRVATAMYYQQDQTADAWTLFDRCILWAGGPVAAGYPTALLKKGFVSAFHCFMSGYIKAKISGLDPLKLPDGTTF